MFLTKPIWGMLIRSLRSINPHLGNGSPEPPEYQSPPGEWHFGASRVPIPTWGMASRSLRSTNPHLGDGSPQPSVPPISTWKLGFGGLGNPRGQRYDYSSGFRAGALGFFLIICRQVPDGGFAVVNEGEVVHIPGATIAACEVITILAG